MGRSDESTDFITAYLREVKKSEGKVKDRYGNFIKRANYEVEKPQLLFV